MSLITPYCGVLLLIFNINVFCLIIAPGGINFSLIIALGVEFFLIIAPGVVFFPPNYPIQWGNTVYTFNNYPWAINFLPNNCPCGINDFSQ